MDQAINAGLALSCYARLALHGMAERGVSQGTFLEIQRLLEHTVIDLSRGQYLDIHFQQRSPDFIPSLDEYLEMVRLKTGVLLGVACEVGALVAGAKDGHGTARRFGEALGTAFQLRDDILGVWGEEAILGKVPGDLEEGRCTLPIVLALQAKSRASHVAGLRGIVDTPAIREQAEGETTRVAQEALRQLEHLGLLPSWEAACQEVVGFAIARNA